MPRISDILSRKGSQVHTVPPDASVLSALALMERHDTGSLVVVSNGVVVGIFTERDAARRVILAERAPATTRVSEVMSAQVICIAADASVQEAMALMTQQRFRHLPVVDGRGMCGVVSIGDLVKSVAEDREVEIRYLTAYIRGELAL